MLCSLSKGTNVFMIISVLPLNSNCITSAVIGGDGLTVERK